jgi:hypothetical protein
MRKKSRTNVGRKSRRTGRKRRNLKHDGADARRVRHTAQGRARLDEAGTPEQLAEVLKRAVDEDAIDDIARRAGFMRRKRTVVPFLLVIALVATLTAQAVWIADILRTFNKLSGERVKYKPFHNQLAKPAFAEFTRLALERVASECTMPVLESLPRGKLSAFSDIVLHDGTSLAVKDSLKNVWPGRFNKVSPAAIELHVTMSALDDNPISITLAPDKEAERAFGPAAEDIRGRLLLEDRGYQSRDFFRAVQKADGFFIVRGTKNIRPTIRQARDPSGQRLRSLRRLEGKQLTWSVLPQRDLDLDIEWGDGTATYTGRLVVFYRPTKRNKNAFVYMHTNLDRSSFSTRDIGQLYRLRWQVELLFKDWKSATNLHRFDTTKAPIAEGLIWASLLAATLRRSITHAAEHILRVPLSTQRAASGARHFLDDILKALLRGRNLLRVLRHALAYLRDNALRAHPARDRKKGRLAAGLRHIALA